MVAYRRPSNGWRLLSVLCTSQNIPTNYFISFIQADGWRLRECGLDRYSLRSKGNIRGRSYIPESGFINWAFLDRQHMGNLLISDPLQL
jgi:hypothetical protein